MVSELLPADRTQTRRALLGAGAGGLLAWLAGAIGGPARTLAAHLPGFGHANNAGAANTTLTTTSTGTALLVTQTGTGTALRGVANNGIAGFFTSANGSGVSGVVAANSKYGVYGGNDATTYGGGAAIRAAGQQNHGLVATTAHPDTSGVRGINNFGPAGSGSGVYGEGFTGVHGLSELGVGVRGACSPGWGVYGISDSSIGVLGESGSSVGVNGISDSGRGVVGASGSDVGVWGASTSNDAVLGSINTAFKSAIVGVNPNALGWAGYFEGNVEVTGVLSGPTLLSRIDHPLDPPNQTLAHAFVGSPEMKNVYDGTVTLDPRGEATVTLPGYFEALNADVHYQLTAIGAAAPDLHVGAPVKDNRFTIAGGQPGKAVSWQVTGVRRDAHAKANPIAVEARKPADRRGRYLDPLAHGQEPSKGWKDLPAPLALPDRPRPIDREPNPPTP